MPGQYGDILMQEPGLRKFIKDNPETKIVIALADKYKEVFHKLHTCCYDTHRHLLDILRDARMGGLYQI